MNHKTSEQGARGFQNEARDHRALGASPRTVSFQECDQGVQGFRKKTNTTLLQEQNQRL